MSLRGICLNPCFSGNRFGSAPTINLRLSEDCLNPCFSGNRFGSRPPVCGFVPGSRVLILVLVEIGLGEVSIAASAAVNVVLILVLVEIGLGGLFAVLLLKLASCLNPCFSGNRFGSTCYYD